MILLSFFGFAMHEFVRHHSHLIFQETICIDSVVFCVLSQLFSNEQVVETDLLWWSVLHSCRLKPARLTLSNWIVWLVRVWMCVSVSKLEIIRRLVVSQGSPNFALKDHHQWRSGRSLIILLEPPHPHTHTHWPNTFKFVIASLQRGWVLLCG